jgi:outer membrane protein assembly factor BamB
MKIATKNSRRYYLLATMLSVLQISCSTSLKSETRERKFVIERSWARQTSRTDYLGTRVNHVSEPLIYKNLVIQGNEIDGIVAYSRKSGKKKWSREIDGGVTSGARQYNGVIYFGAGDGFFYALDALTGQTKWSTPIRAEGVGAPLVTETAIYFLAGNNSAFALKTQTGEQIWFYNRIDSASITVRGASEPTMIGNRVYAGFSDGYLVALDKDKGAVLWEKQLGLSARFRDIDSKPVVDGDRIYVSSYDGQLYCLKSSDGQTVWVNDEGGFTPVTIVNSTLYYSTSTRKVLALEKSSGKVLWSRDLASGVAGQPIFHRGLVLVGEWSGGLRALDAINGKDVSEFITGRGVTSRPVVDPTSDYVYIMTADANLFAVHLKLKDLAEVWPWEN